MSSQALIDKIIRTAEGEAELITDEIIKRAGESERIILGKVDAECAEIRKAAEEKAAQIKRTSALLSELDARKAALRAKRDVMDRAYGEAFDRLVSLDTEKRIPFIRSLILKYAPDSVITLTLTEVDRRYFDEASVRSIEKELADKFGRTSRITVSEKPAKFKGGVFMESAISDVDASFEAIFEELRRGTEAEVSRILFD